MNPWIADAGGISPDEDLSNYIYKNDLIEKYLQIGDHERNFILLAPKGLGKTLILNYKSYLYRHLDHLKGYKFSPDDQLSENLSIITPQLSKEELLNFQDLPLWIKIWHFTLYVLLYRTHNLKLPQKLESIFKGADRASIILSLLLSSRGRLYDILSYSLELKNQVNKIQSGTAIFIDNVDQGFEVYLKEYHYSDDHLGPENPSVRVWINAQLGLIISSYMINKDNSHLKIFVTIRSEAFTYFESPIKQNILSYSTKLSYNKNEVKKIFEKNIELMDEKELVDTKAIDTIRRFSGIQEIEHLIVRTSDGKKMKESLFDFFYRHTFGRPREIVMIGHQLTFTVLNNDEYRKAGHSKKEDLIRWAIDSLSNDFFENYKTEIIPRFDEEILKIFCASIKKNTIRRTELNQIDDKIIRFLIGAGMLGYVSDVEVQRKQKKTIQKFYPAAEYNYTHLDLIPDSDCYVTHPTMDHTLNSQLGLKFYNEHSIIGYDYEFFSTQHKEVEKLNLHFGPGKLGLGLVVPLLVKQHVAVCIFHSPANVKWQKLINYLESAPEETIIVRLSYGQNFKFSVFKDSDGNVNFDKILNKWEKGENIWIFSENKYYLEEVIKRSNSITTSVKTLIAANSIATTLNKIIPESEINIYPFENERKIITQMDSTLSQKKYNIIPLTCDRICSDMQFINNVILVNCEEYHQVFFYAKNEKVNSMFNYNNNVVLRKNELEENFDYSQKTGFVNSTHTILAIYIKEKLNEVGDEKVDLDLINLVHLIMHHSEIKNNLQIFIKIQALKLIFETQEFVLSNVYHTDDKSIILTQMLKFGYETLERFEKQKDSVQRILGGLEGLKLKFDKHIKPVLNFIKINENQKKIVQWKLLDVLEVDGFKDKVIDLEEKILSILFKGT